MFLLHNSRQMFPNLTPKLLLLLLAAVALLAKQSEQRGIPQSDDTNSSNSKSAEESSLDDGPEVLIPASSKVEDNDDGIGIDLSSASISQRLAEAEENFLARQLLKAAGLDRNELRPRSQRWLLRTESLKDHPLLGAAEAHNGLQFPVKRVVSESELNSLLKNAWLGRK